MKRSFPGSAMLAPVPAALISCGDTAHPNAMTAAWIGMVCTDPPMLSVSIRPERVSYPVIKESGCFTVNLTTEALVRATDYCGVRSGKNVDKAAVCGFHYEPGEAVSSPDIAESPVNLECRVKEIRELGSHHMILAEILNVRVEEALISREGRIALEKAGLISYCHGQYFALGELLGSFGYSVQKKKTAARRQAAKRKFSSHPRKEGKA